MEKKGNWGAIFNVEDPRARVHPSKGKILDVNQALEVARFDIQYLDWRARQDVLTIMLLHDKVLGILLLHVSNFLSIVSSIEVLVFR